MRYSLSTNDVPRCDLIKVFESIHAANQYRSPEAFQKVLFNLLDLFPTNQIVCGSGNLNELKINQLININFPNTFLQAFVEENLLERSGLFFEWMRTRRPILWLDVFEKTGSPFSPSTKTGFDQKYVGLVYDHKVDLTLWSGNFESFNVITAFCLNFLNKKDAEHFGDLFQIFIPFLSHSLLNCNEQANSKSNIKESVPELLPKELEVLKWLIEGKTNWEIGCILDLSERTIKFHVKNLMKKFNATNRYHLVAKAIFCFYKIPSLNYLEPRFDL
jgi:DNA-binding CsgD family transcriptional regulator